MMEFDLSSLLVQLAEALSPFLVALVSYLAYQGAAWLRHRITNEQARMALDLAQSAVIDTVAAGGDTFRAELRKAAADGVVTPEEMRVIRERTLFAAKRQAGAEVMDAIERIHLNPDEWLWTKIKAEAHTPQALVLEAGADREDLPETPETGPVLR